MTKSIFGKDVHTFLSERAKEKIEKAGYEAIPEFEAENDNKKYRVDLVGKKGNENIAIECLVKPNRNIIEKKIEQYRNFFQKIIFVLPENSSYKFSITSFPIEVWKFKIPKEIWENYGKRLIIDLSEQQLKEMEKMIRAGMYKTETEAIRDAVQELLEEKRGLPSLEMVENMSIFECIKT